MGEQFRSIGQLEAMAMAIAKTKELSEISDRRRQMHREAERAASPERMFKEARRAAKKPKFKMKGLRP